MKKVLTGIAIIASASLAMAQGPRHHGHTPGKAPVSHAKHYSKPTVKPQMPQHGKPGIAPQKPVAKPQMPQHGKPGIAPQKPVAKPQMPQHGKPGIAPQKPATKPQMPQHGKPGIAPQKPVAKPQPPHHGKPGITPHRPGAKPQPPSPEQDKEQSIHSSDVANSTGNNANDPVNHKYPGDGPTNNSRLTIKDYNWDKDKPKHNENNSMEYNEEFWKNVNNANSK